MARSVSRQSEHDRVVCYVGRKLFNNGYDVAVDGECDFPERLGLPIFSEYPPECGDEEYRRPDIYAEKLEKVVIGEVETEDTISSERTKCQLSTFSMNGDTIVYVPSNAVATMQDNLRRWKLTDVKIVSY